MNLVYEQNVIGLQVSQQRRQIAWAFQHRSGGLAQAYTHFIGDDMGQRGLAKARRAKQQYMVQRLVAPTSGGDKNLHLPPDGFLSDVF